MSRVVQNTFSIAGLCLALMFPALAGDPETGVDADPPEKSVAQCTAGSRMPASAPARVIGRDGAVRYEYAGDAQGNLWRYDVAETSAEEDASHNNKTLIFTATDANGKPQPIMQKPSVVFAPGGYLVLFGTGKFSEPSDALPANFSMQSFYGIYDEVNAQHGVIARTGLEKRQLGKSGDAFNVTGNPPGKFLKGWYLDFPDSESTGERSVTSSLVISNLLVLHTLIPGNDFCGNGTGRIYILNALTGLPVNGGATGFPAGAGMHGPPALDRAESELMSKDALGRWVVRTKYLIDIPEAGGARRAAKRLEITAPAEYAGRLSWREIFSWENGRDANGKKH